ncbi:membrane protein complex assembly protein [Schizosaccharomyces cryophilus OY26]|uniref:Cytochrome b mRNA-processing protein 4 n=1 Tax=Schizosaccharomyces cryophilus (strain OY26 / ATCC MYA-4695 / CBS 11777 / NBRC 106824 / NRRL Y48691) TaxID=653667 RepID=S9X674_SCHCR|nr:membrane protein complex assembly protein [Schizosaccharomyces cryophilus OY26]EPY49281.1 membrane protein complex assembly protein [Schizosaccharomyces cryophilus OY26]
MNRIVKSLLYGVGIVGFGYATMKITTPSPQHVIDSLSPELRADYEKRKKDSRPAEGVLHMIEEARRNPKDISK